VGDFRSFECSVLEESVDPGWLAGLSLEEYRSMMSRCGAIIRIEPGVEHLDVPLPTPGSYRIECFVGAGDAALAIPPRRLVLYEFVVRHESGIDTPDVLSDATFEGAGGQSTSSPRGTR
jgi:hypothetical protein